MFKSLVALASAAALAGCAGTAPNAASAAENCKMIAQDNTDSHIKVRQQCDSGADESATQSTAGPQG